MIDLIWDRNGKAWKIVDDVLCHRELQTGSEKGKKITLEYGYRVGSLRPATQADVEAWRNNG